MEQLTNREFEVASLLVRGLLKKEVGDRLKISVNTVRNHAQSIYEKVGVSTIGELCFFWNEKKMGNQLLMLTPGPAKIFERKRRIRQFV